MKVKKEIHPIAMDVRQSACRKEKVGGKKRTDFSGPEVLRGLVAWLAASQGFGTAAARSISLSNALAAPSPLARNCFGHRHDEREEMEPQITTHQPKPVSSGRKLKGAGDNHTYVTNRSTAEIQATTIYDCFSGYPKSKFKNRVIKPGGVDVDEYSAQSKNVEGFIDTTAGRRGSASGSYEASCVAKVIVALKGTAWTKEATVTVDPDRSIFVVNTPNAGTLDVFLEKTGPGVKPLTPDGGKIGTILNG